MGGKLKHFRASCTILLLMLLLQSAVAKKKSKDDDRNKLLAEYEAFEKQVHETVTSMLSKLTEEETCEKGDPSCDPSAAQLPKELEPALESLLAWLKNMDDILKTLIPVVTKLTPQRGPTKVSKAVVRPKLNATVTISCESDGDPISLCIWRKMVNGQMKTIVLDDVGVQNSESEFGGVSYEGERQTGGKCGLKIQAVQVQDIGRWFCHLITTAGPVLTGEVVVGLTVSKNDKISAHVPQPMVTTWMNESASFTCESPVGQELNLCLWEQMSIEDRGGMVIVDEQRRTGGEHFDGTISLLGGYSLKDGKCGLKINAISKADLPSDWTCTLVTKNGNIFTGSVTISQKLEPAIYFATWGGGIKAYSPLTSHVTTIVSSEESCYGIAYDSIHNKIYWSTFQEYMIYRTNIDGSLVETVLSTEHYGSFQGVAFDWISGNLYIGTDKGNAVMCDTNHIPSPTCHLLFSGQNDVEDIALDVVCGIMYWTSSPRGWGSIWKSGLDGSSPYQIVTGLKWPRGIVIDFLVSRLYWTDHFLDQIQSSNFDGGDVHTIYNRLAGPYGIALVGKNIFWGNSDNTTLQSITKGETVIRTHHTDSHRIRHITVVPNLELPTNRTNHCEGLNCSGICVLTTTSSRCIN